MGEPTEIINAAGKLTSLGGSAQSEAVADAQRRAAQRPVDLKALRAEVAFDIAEACGAERACITSGAAAGISIAVAAAIAGDDPDLVRQLPTMDKRCSVLLQAGHNIDFGAPIEQMIRLGGGDPLILGGPEMVSEAQLADALATESVVAMLFVVSHYCVQTNQLSLEQCVELCACHDVPVIVDAAAETDLQKYIVAGADLVICSGGKAIGGPTSGFVVGQRTLIDACELQFGGIARTMKIGKEAITGLSAALREYVRAGGSERLAQSEVCNRQLMAKLADVSLYGLRELPDEAGRAFSRVAVSLTDPSLDIHDLAMYLSEGNPSIRTRNHHLAEGYLLIDPRELAPGQVAIIVARLRAFAASR